MENKCIVNNRPDLSNNSTDDHIKANRKSEWPWGGHLTNQSTESPINGSKGSNSYFSKENFLHIPSSISKQSFLRSPIRNSLKADIFLSGFSNSRQSAISKQNRRKSTDEKQTSLDKKISEDVQIRGFYSLPTKIFPSMSDSIFSFSGQNNHSNPVNNHSTKECMIMSDEESSARFFSCELMDEEKEHHNSKNTQSNGLLDQIQDIMNDDKNNETYENIPIYKMHETKLEGNTPPTKNSKKDQNITSNNTYPLQRDNIDSRFTGNYKGVDSFSRKDTNNKELNSNGGRYDAFHYDANSSKHRFKNNSSIDQQNYSKSCTNHPNIMGNRTRKSPTCIDNTGYYINNIPHISSIGAHMQPHGQIPSLYSIPYYPIESYPSPPLYSPSISLSPVYMTPVDLPSHPMHYRDHLNYFNNNLNETRKTSTKGYSENNQYFKESTQVKDNTNVNPWKEKPSDDHRMRSRSNSNKSRENRRFYLVEFKKYRQSIFCGSVGFTMDEFVKVEGDRGHDIGKVIKISDSLETIAESSPIHKRPNEIIKKIISSATDEEIYYLKNKTKEENEVLKICREKSEERSFPMHIIDVEYQYDKKKLIIYYAALKRIDFRDYVKSLYSLFQTRIWLERITK